jgi:hypothetical protein
MVSFMSFGVVLSTMVNDFENIVPVVGFITFATYEPAANGS